MAPQDPQQGVEYASFVRTELDREYARRDAVNARSATATTSATGLVTLVIAAAAVVRGQAHLLDDAATFWLFVAVIALLAAAICAVVAGLSWGFKVTTPTALSTMLTSKWGDDPVAARSIVAQADLTTLSSLRSGTNSKTRFLLGAYALQVVAIGALFADLAVIAL